MEHALYECEICGSWHPWKWDGDCRDDANRYGDPEEYAARNGVAVHEIELFSMNDRVEADE
jgi:hypothetical protein